jgi:hypothetical protein
MYMPSSDTLGFNAMMGLEAFLHGDLQLPSHVLYLPRCSLNLLGLDWQELVRNQLTTLLPPSQARYPFDACNSEQFITSMAWGEAYPEEAQIPRYGYLTLRQ